MTRRAPLELALVLAGVLAGCQVDLSQVDFGCHVGGMCDDGTGWPLWMSGIVGFPAAAIEGPDAAGHLWGRIQMGDTMHLALVSFDARSQTSCEARDTLHGIRWAIAERGPSDQVSDTSAAEVIGSDSSGVVRIVARAPGAFGVTYYRNVAGYDDPRWEKGGAELLHACETASRTGVLMVRVVARPGMVVLEARPAETPAGRVRAS